MKGNQQNAKGTLNSEENKKDTAFLSNDTIEKCNENCILNNQYYIDKSQPILPLLNNFCEAYHVKDIQNSNNQGLYAKILKRPMVLKVSDIQHIVSNNIDNFLNPIAIGTVDVEIKFHDTPKEYITIIYRKISGVSLGELIDKNEYFSDRYIIKNIIYSINEVLRKLHNLNIAHGSINLDNIYLTNDGIVVGECFASPCGYNQSHFYEPVSIPKALSYAKSNKNFSADYYALGIICLELILGKRIKKNRDKLDAGRIYMGSYRYYIGNTMLTGTINRIIQGLLQDNEKERFGYEELSNIASLKNFIPKTASEDFSQPIYFNNKKVYSAKALAYEMSINLKKAKNLVYSGTLQVFLQKFDNTKKFFKQINHILKNSIKLPTNFDFYTKQDFNIAEIIKSLSSQDIFAVKELSICFEKHVIANVILHFVSNNEWDKLKILTDIIQYQIGIYPDKFKENNFFYIYNSIVNINCNDHVFNLLLTLYKTFPKLPYLGALGQGKIIASISKMLTCLEKECPKQTLFTDKHIEVFLCSRLKIDYFQKIKQLKYLSYISNFHSIKLLILFTEAQKECEINELPHLSDIFAQNIISTISTFLHSNQTKQNFIKEVNSAKNKGNLEDILNIIIQDNFLQNDIKNYQNNVMKAKKIHNKLNATLSELEVNSLLEQKCFKTTLTISYLLFSIAVLYMVVRLLT